MTARTVRAAFGAMMLLATAAAAAEEKPKASLYERLGGVYPIAVVVDDFIERLVVNKTLNANPAIRHARDAVPKAGLKYQVTSFVAQAAGGPQQYVGRSMKTAHAHLNISEKEWRVMVSELKKSLAKFKVPAHEQQDLIALLATTKSNIVTVKH